jgi:sulfur-oxidizing protein SoxY
MKAGTASATRRQALHGGLWSALLACGLLPPARAGERAPEIAFDASSLEEALSAMGGELTRTQQILLSVPGVVENGAFVPVSVRSSLPDTQQICIVVASNPNPVVVRFSLPEGTEPMVSTRVKVAESGRVYAVVRAADRLYCNHCETQVSVGGCG